MTAGLRISPWSGARLARSIAGRPKLACVHASSRLRSAGYSSVARGAEERRTAIVTGSSRGIGRAIAVRLAADGYDICINDVAANEAGCQEAVREIQGLGRSACYALADVSSRDEVDSLVQTSVRELGPLNAMIANAGIAQVKPLLEVSPSEFERMMRVNVLGVHNCYASAARQLIAQGNCTPEKPGKLVGAASIVSFKPFPLLGHYSASKFAVRGLTQAYAMELASHGITVNAYAPGIVGTAMWDLIDAEMAKRKGMRRGEVLDKMVRENTALGRVSVSEDVAKLVSFLASSDSDFVTGQTQVVDGGIVFS